MSFLKLLVNEAAEDECDTSAMTSPNQQAIVFMVISPRSDN